MRTSSRWVVLLGLLCGLALGGCSRPSWKEYSSPSGGYKVLMYGQPQEETDQRGPLTVHVVGCRPAKGATYSVSYVDYPVDAKELAQPDFTKKKLKEAVYGTVAKTRGKVPDLKEVKAEPHSGFEMKIADPDGGFHRVRMFQVKGRLYQITVQGPEEVVDSDDAVRFLDSFQFTEGKNAG